MTVASPPTMVHRVRSNYRGPQPMVHPPSGATPLIVGPVFYRELATAPRRPRLYLYRSIYAAALVILISTAWLLLAGAQVIRSVGDTARFGTIMFQWLSPLQLALVSFVAAMSSASAIAQEKDRRTLLLLLMTRLTSCELVVGKLLGSLLYVFVMVAAAVPIFMLTVLFGGISFEQVGRVMAVTVTTMLAAGSLGALLAFWREKTFQTLALTALLLVLWIGLWEGIAVALGGRRLLGLPTDVWATGFSPIQAVLAAARPFVEPYPALGPLGHAVNLYLLTSTALTLTLCAVTVARVRVWNPSREVRRGGQSEEEVAESIWGVAHDLGTDQAGVAERARGGHVDARLRERLQHEPSREVWDNPILWREMRTWAYGRKVIAIRVAYVALILMAAVALHVNLAASPAAAGPREHTAAIPSAAFFLVSLVIINALAVTSITTERDGRSLDLLLATDLSPREFVFGKLGGVLYVAGLMVIAPMLLTLYAWWRGGISLENTGYVFVGLAVMDVFVATLGMHCGMRYANSRSAIGVSLGTVFFLFLGVVACMTMMVLFSASFQIQLAPFLAFILGGGVGLYVALGIRNASPAIAAAAILLPFATFYAITSFLLQNNLAVFLVTVCTYGFTTAAMLVPALAEFDFAMGRTSAADE